MFNNDSVSHFGDKIHITTTYPGLDVELSKDNGTTWQLMMKEFINDADRAEVLFPDGKWESVLLRTKFK